MNKKRRGQDSSIGFVQNWAGTSTAAQFRVVTKNTATKSCQSCMGPIGLNNPSTKAAHRRQAERRQQCAAGAGEALIGPREKLGRRLEALADDDRRHGLGSVAGRTSVLENDLDLLAHLAK